jgi:NAD(P)-dependent dehydrogenase (short-subunit alcohol dehydrogenase family)
MFSLQGKIAVITGGGSGIGKAIAKLFAKQGATVFIFDLDKPGAVDTVNEISIAGGTAHFVQCNVADQQNVKEAVQQVDKTGNAIHILVNNAGVAHVGNAENTNEEDFTRLFNINVKGVYNCLHEILPVMKTTGGVILNMASIAALVGITDRFAYSMTKGAIAGITLSTARDYLQHGIRCNSISPARVHTPFVDGFIAKNYPGKEEETFKKLSESQPIGRMGTVDEIAMLALYLCSNEAGFISGNDYPIDGGFVKLNN